MVTIKTMKSFFVSGYIVNTSYEIRQYYEFSNVFVSREEDSNRNNHLIAYGYSKDEFKVIWKFHSNNVVGIHPIIPDLKRESDFNSIELFNRYLDKYKGKELLEVFAGEFRYIVDANTGEIYEKMDSR